MKIDKNDLKCPTHDWLISRSNNGIKLLACLKSHLQLTGSWCHFKQTLEPRVPLWDSTIYRVGGRKHRCHPGATERQPEQLLIESDQQTLRGRKRKHRALARTRLFVIKRKDPISQRLPTHGLTFHLTPSDSPKYAGFKSTLLMCLDSISKRGGGRVSTLKMRWGLIQLNLYTLECVV